MRESSHNLEPINHQNVEQSEVKSVWKFESDDSNEQIHDEVLPYVQNQTEEGVYTGVFIADLLGFSDEHMIDVLSKQDLKASVFIDQYYKNIKKAIEEGIILKTAPWFKMLENKIMAIEIYIAGLVDEAELEKSRNAFLDEIKKKFS